MLTRDVASYRMRLCTVGSARPILYKYPSLHLRDPVTSWLPPSPQVMNKFNDILEQFAREIEQTADIFERNKDSPPVTKNQPPVAGAIKWVRSLLERLKRTMAKLLSTEEDMIRTTEVGQAVEAKFKAFARSVMLTEKKWFSTWSESINAVAMQHLKQTIFRRNATTSESQGRNARCRESGRWPEPCVIATTSCGSCQHVFLAHCLICRPRGGQLPHRPDQAHPRDALPGPHGLSHPGDRAQRGAAGAQLCGELASCCPTASRFGRLPDLQLIRRCQECARAPKFERANISLPFSS